MNSYVNTYRKSSTFQRHPGANSMSLVTGLLPFTSEMALFEFPFNELLIWSVLTKRQEMSILMWAHGEESLAKSLVACKLYKAMAHEAAEDDLDTEIYDELKSYAKDFEAKGLKLLDFCYRVDAERSQRLLTCELHSWSNQSCLSLAVSANHRALLAHPCSQVILADLWMGGLRTRKNTNLKVNRQLRKMTKENHFKHSKCHSTGYAGTDFTAIHHTIGFQIERRTTIDATNRRGAFGKSKFGLWRSGEKSSRCRGNRHFLSLKTTQKCFTSSHSIETLRCAANCFISTTLFFNTKILTKSLFDFNLDLFYIFFIICVCKTKTNKTNQKHPSLVYRSTDASVATKIVNNK